MTPGSASAQLDHWRQRLRPMSPWLNCGVAGLAVRQPLKERLGSLGAVEEHRFHSGWEEGVNPILRLPGREPKRRPLLVAA